MSHRRKLFWLYVALWMLKLGTPWMWAADRCMAVARWLRMASHRPARWGGSKVDDE